MPQFHPANPRFVAQSEPTFEIQASAVATPFVLQGQAFSGAIYDRSGALVRRSLRFCGPTEKVHSTDPEFLTAPEHSEAVPGVGYYIGNIMSHYGHFITEGLSSFWLSGAQQFDYFVAHPFVWGAEIPAFARQAYALLGVDPDRIRVIRNPAHFETLIIPDRLWLMNASVNAEYRKTISRMNGRYLSAKPTLKLYLSRARIPRRAVPNEPAIEDAFRRAGFVVIHPQNLGFAAQLELFGQTAILAGLAGSALHNVIFCPQGTATISVGDRRAALTRNQPVCGALVEGATVVIPYADSPGGFDIPTLEAELDNVFRTWAG